MKKEYICNSKSQDESKRNKKRLIIVVSGSIYEHGKMLYHKGSIIGEEILIRYDTFYYFTDTLYEERFDKHREVLLNLKEEDILTVAQMFEQMNNKEFGKETSNTKGSCSFRYSYISSYLLIRGCLNSV